MFFDKIKALIKHMEDPKNPLLGPTIRGLYFFSVWNNFGSKIYTAMYCLRHFLTFSFVVTQFIDTYIERHDINKWFNNISVLGLSVICVAKLYSCLIWQGKWKALFSAIAEEEIYQKRKGNALECKRMDEYTRYTRIITYGYWCIVFLTVFLMIVTPFLRYISSPGYRQEISLGREPLPQVVVSWLPFDKNKMPGYLFATGIQIYMSYRGAIVLALYDMYAIPIMVYFKGQLIIIQEKCNKLFEDATTFNDVEYKIKECHRHHNVLLKHYKMFNSLLSPTMFLYMFMCSITICGTIIQLSSGQTTLSQKVWVIQYTGSLVLQLFMYCWHGNEVTNESINVDRGIYNSNWWDGNLRERRHLILLAGKLGHTFSLSAGPFTFLSVTTFINIIKGAYSIHTLFSQIQEI